MKKLTPEQYKSELIRLKALGLEVVKLSTDLLSQTEVVSTSSSKKISDSTQRMIQRRERHFQRKINQRS